MGETKLKVAGVGNDGSMLVRVDDVRNAIQTIHDDYAKQIAELESQVQFKVKECTELASACHRYKKKLQNAQAEKLEAIKVERKRWFNEVEQCDKFNQSFNSVFGVK